MNRYHRIALVLGFVMVFTLAKWGPFVFAEDDKFSLRGLKGAYVLVEDLRPEIERGGLSKTQIQTDVELKLRMAGIVVLSREEFYDALGRPYLYVNVTALKDIKDRGYAYYVSVKLQQEVYLVRTPLDFTKYDAVTWEVGNVATSPNIREIRADVKDQVDIFINAYLSVNPAKPEKRNK